MSIDIIQLTSSLPAEQRKAVERQYQRRAKDSTTAFLLCFFLGIFGAHCFYLGRNAQGILRLVISPLIVPGLVWEIVDLFRVDHEVHTLNLKLAEQLVATAMLAVPNSMALETAIDQLDATLRKQEAQAAAPGAVTSIPVQESQPERPAEAEMLPVAAAPLAVAGVSLIESDAPSSSPQVQADDDMFVAAPTVEQPAADPQDSQPAPATSLREWAPPWPRAPEPALAAEHTAAADAKPDTTQEIVPNAVPVAFTAEPVAAPTWPGATERGEVPAAELAESTSDEGADEAGEPPQTADVVAVASDAFASAPGEPSPNEPGMAALAFGWLQSVPGAVSDDSTPEWSEREVAASASASQLAPESAPRGDLTDQYDASDGAAATADVGELAGATRITVALPDEVLAADPADSETAFAVSPAVATEAVEAPEPETTDPLLVFVADEGEDPELGLTSGEVALASLGAVAAGATPEFSATANDATPPAPTADYQAHIAEEPHPDAEAAGAEPRRVVKRVRVIRRLVVNGQVVRETSAEQVVDGDADAQETAANLQRTLSTADPDTLQALTTDPDATLPPGTVTPTPPLQYPDAPSAGQLDTH
jgi:TM2 domain-containing membrane protein YozV